MHNTSIAMPVNEYSLIDYMCMCVCMQETYRVNEPVKDIKVNK